MTLDICGWCTNQFKKNKQDPPCKACKYILLNQANLFAFAFFREIASLGGCGYTQDGLFSFGEFRNGLADGLAIYSHFKPVPKSHRIYMKLKIIIALFNEFNAERREQLDKHGT